MNQDKPFPFLKIALIMVTALVAFIAGIIGLAGIGAKVEVPPASVGKIITRAGYQDGLIGTSKFRVDWCLIYCDRLAILQIADRTEHESENIYMPKDKLLMKVSVRSTLRIDPTRAEEIFKNIAPSATNDENTVLIPQKTVYDTYASAIIKVITREHVSQYSIAEVASNIEAINNELRVKIQDELKKKTPFLVSNVDITEIDYPPVIMKAQTECPKDTSSY